MMIGEIHFRFQRFFILAAVLQVFMVLIVFDAHAQPQTKSEREAGEEIVAVYLGAAPLTQNVNLNRYVSLVGTRVASKSDRSALTWTFGVLASGSVNAFSAPGGYILVTVGLLRMLDTEDELAAVLAHEVAHVVRQHHWKIIQKQQQASALVAKMQGNMKTSNELFTDMNSLFSDMMTRGLDKSAEFEADRDAMILAANAGYDCTAIFSLLSKLEGLKGSSESSSLIFQTHPSPAQRMDELSSAVVPELDSCATPSPAAGRYQRYVKSDP
jgi:predicted Zn-dependent protease